MARGMGGSSPANVTHHLAGIDFPANREDLVRHAKRQGAERAVLDVLNRMPDKRYDDLADVMKGYGETDEDEDEDTEEG